MATVAVDFDGVIHAYRHGWQDGTIYDEPVPGALDAISALMARGVAVFVHTTRDAETVAAWLAERGVPAVHGLDESVVFWDDPARVLVTPRKLPAVAYIDDRAIRFVDWPQALGELAEREGIALPDSAGPV
ncbi:hypothetical protein [Bailinhaonella thermotolerans]|uniref:Uncharacterized protein n=1 Tax=Bailinhaonella thermotolerans TaxID=1070861 RepID=A0A3A4A4U0_9ACTN|nr:hypothetical protein [Bailinhaonella thermotolerans]RJL19347.1 hypothetical protein D5H75_40500 [Bailinhaonella thermotolerans]